jgi:hypothetical protein
MVITTSEYDQIRAAYMAIAANPKLIERITIDGQEAQYTYLNLAELKSLMVGFEMANGMVASRTYARQIRRR